MKFSFYKIINLSILTLINWISPAIKLFSARKTQKIISKGLISCFFLIIVTNVFSYDDWIPWEKKINLHKTKRLESSSIIYFPVKFFRKHISPVDGDRCSMYPTCSKYSLNAFRANGFLLGQIMTFDRLMRCGRNELDIAPLILINDEVVFYDPVTNNDFWWQ